MTDKNKYWIQDFGFEACSKSRAGRKCQYEKCVHSGSGLYSLWFSLDLISSLVYVQVELTNGGLLSKRTECFVDMDINNEDVFKPMLNDLINKYLELYK